jgi:RNA polymerase sigma-70 factor (ECF subfamily)
LSPVQRATLLLRDVVGLSAEETANVLDLSVPAANSALFRARTAIEEKIGPRDVSSFAEEAAVVNRALLAEYVRAFEHADVDALLAILHDEVKTTMPPSPMWVDGLAANILLYKRLMTQFTPGSYRLVPTQANGQAAWGFYRASSPSEPRILRAINVVEVRDGKIARVDHFMNTEMFAVFRLPDRA